MFIQRYLQQWEHEQRDDDNLNGVRFTSVTLIKHDRQQERRRGRTYSCCRLLRFPKLSGMVPLSPVGAVAVGVMDLQQWEHEQQWEYE